MAENEAKSHFVVVQVAGEGPAIVGDFSKNAADDHTHCAAGVGCEGWDEDCDNCADCVVCHPLTALPRGPFPAPEPPYIPAGGGSAWLGPRAG